MARTLPAGTAKSGRRQWLEDPEWRICGHAPKHRYSDRERILRLPTARRIQRSAGNGSSGVYLCDKYEVQIFNSYGKTPVDTDCGALYKRIAPAVNPSNQPGQWQTFDITFIGKRLMVVHNGQKVLDVSDVGPTGTGASSNRPDGPGPLRLQGDHDAVSFRNIRIRPLSKSEAEKLPKA